jgi:hypothetical protein
MMDDLFVLDFDIVNGTMMLPPTHGHPRNFTEESPGLTPFSSSSLKSISYDCTADRSIFNPRDRKVCHLVSSAMGRKVGGFWIRGVEQCLKADFFGRQERSTTVIS